MIKTIKYDTIDREILRALHDGVDAYENNAEQRVLEIRRGRAQSVNKKNSELKKLAAFGRV